MEGESAAVDCVTTEGLVGAELAEYMTLNDDWEEAEAGKLSKFHLPSCWQQILITKLLNNSLHSVKKLNLLEIQEAIRSS